MEAHQVVDGRISRSIAVEPAALGSLLPPCTPPELPTRRDLLLQALLHMPRIADDYGNVSLASATAEIERLREIRAAELSPFRELARAPRVLPTLGDLVVRVADAEEAAPVLGHFHYLRSVREDSVFVGAFYTDRLAAVCSVSPLDLPSVIEQLPIANSAQGAVISRVFAFDWAPRNVISYLLARTERCHVAVREDVRILLTYLNPNMGFTGASYRAANWITVGRETGTRYAYLDERYITDRQVNALASEVRPEVRYSRMPLLPLALLCRTLDKSLRAAEPGGFRFVIPRQDPATCPAFKRPGNPGTT